MHRRCAWLAMLPCAALPVPCATKPDLARLYRAHGVDPQRVPVILISGALGSRLARAETGQELWPGSERKLLTGGYHELAMRIDPATLEPAADGIVAGGQFDAAVRLDFYGRIVEALRKIGGYHPGNPGQAVVL